jgi:hypothetical protein
LGCHAFVARQSLNRDRMRCICAKHASVAITFLACLYKTEKVVVDGYEAESVRPRAAVEVGRV